MAEPHDFDTPTGWCKTCGIARADAVDANRECADRGGNVTGISHIVRASPSQLAASILLERRGYPKPDDSK